MIEEKINNKVQELEAQLQRIQDNITEVDNTVRALTSQKERLVSQGLQVQGAIAVMRQLIEELQINGSEEEPLEKVYTNNSSEETV